MNCENCQTALLDLVYDELEESLEVQARAHIEECEACRLSYEKLSQAVYLAGQLPQLEPPERVSEEIRAAAYAKFAISTKRSVVAKTSIQENFRKLVGFVGHLAMGRQVAMAMVMLLIVAFGLHYLPHLRRKPKATGGTVVNPDGSGEAGPSNELTPAEPFDLTVDLPRGRIRSKESVQSDDRHKESVATLEAERVEETRRGPTLPEGTNDDNRMEKSAVADRFAEAYRIRRSSRGGGLAADKRASSPSRSDGRDERLAAQRARDEIGSTGERENAQGEASILSSAPIAKSKSKRKGQGSSRDFAPHSEVADGPMAFPYAAQPAAKRVKPQARARAAIPTPTEQTDIAGEAESDEIRESVETLYRRGVARYRSGDYSNAINDLNRVIDRDTAQALRAQTLFYLGRSYQASGRYSLAIKNYRLLISGFPRHNQTGPAMLEAAQCLRRLGRIEEARGFLERAALIPSTAERARRELMSLE